MAQPTKAYVSPDGSAVWLTDETSEDRQDAQTDAVILNSASLVRDCAKQTLRDIPNAGANELYGTLTLTLAALDDVLKVAMER